MSGRIAAMIRDRRLGSATLKSIVMAVATESRDEGCCRISIRLGESVAGGTAPPGKQGANQGRLGGGDLRRIQTAEIGPWLLPKKDIAQSTMSARRKLAFWASNRLPKRAQYHMMCATCT